VIVKAFIDVVAGVWSWFMGIAEWCPVPSWLTGTSDQVAGVGDIVGGSGAWLPWTVVFDALALFVCAVSCALFLILIRMVISLMTGGGGNASGG
jgi:hypothetical protein